MSDLAPFVAATLRDKVVQDLMEEVEAMRKQIRQSRCVEITGPDGTPVYALAQFEDGGYGANSNLWDVIFSEENQALPCPLSMLEGIEIRLGGVCKAKFTDNSVFETLLDDDSRDYENGKAAHIYFCGSSNLWLGIMIDGWPRQGWQATINEDLGPDELWSHLVQNVAVENPNKTVTFSSIRFVARNVSGVIQSLNRDPAIEEDDARRRDENAFLRLILRLMREAGNEENAFEIARQGQAMLSALHELGVDGPGDSFERYIDPLIEAQMQSLSQEEFNLFVTFLSRLTSQSEDGGDDAHLNDEDE